MCYLWFTLKKQQIIDLNYIHMCKMPFSKYENSILCNKWHDICLNNSVILSTCTAHLSRFPCNGTECPRSSLSSLKMLTRLEGILTPPGTEKARPMAWPCPWYGSCTISIYCLQFERYEENGKIDSWITRLYASQKRNFR